MTARMKRALVLILLCIVAGFLAWYVLNWSDWVKGWVGTHFKLLTGSLLGWLVARYFLCIHLSSIENPVQRGLGGLSIALMMAAFAAGAAFGV